MRSLQVRFGAAVRQLRAEAGFSQESFAYKARIARSYMGLLERGRVNPTLTTAEKIANSLKLTVGELMTKVDEEK
jgi:transcriptional regulator with XRE-family HTH domain